METEQVQGQEAQDQKEKRWEDDWENAEIIGVFRHQESFPMGLSISCEVESA